MQQQLSSCVHSRVLAPVRPSRRRLLRVNNSNNNELTRSTKCRVKVVGVGGAGSDAVNRMSARQMPGVELYVMNTDAQELAQSPLPLGSKVLLGARTADGCSTRGNTDLGKAATLEGLYAISKAIHGADLVVVVAGMGGGVGSAVAPVVADIARRQGALTVAVAGMPRTLPARQAATAAVSELEQAADAFVVVPSHKLLEGSDVVMSNEEVYSVSNRLMAAGVDGMVEWVTNTGGFGDLGDFRGYMCGGRTWLGHATAIGPDRAACAATAAINSPLRLGSADRCSSLMVLVSAPCGFKMTEMADISEVLYSHCDEDVRMMVCMTENPAAVSSVSVTVFATQTDPNSSSRAQSMASLMAADAQQR